MIAKEILEKYLEYVCFWNASKGAENPPSKILERQLTSLMKAVDIFPNENTNEEHDTFFYFFEYGDFFDKNTHTDDILTLKMKVFVDECIQQSEHARRLEARKNTIEYRQIFNTLLSFRIKIEMLYIPEGIQYEGFGSFAKHFCNHQKGNILIPLKKTLEEIDEILCILIDPTQKNIDKETLISEYEYPTEDLKSVANDWFADGF